MQTASSSTSSSRRWKYDVFLSFRGEDTRKSFIDHLYAAFKQKGLHVFKDDKELERGKLISPELLHAIEESRFAVVVFSRNYASSTWCLDELVQIVHCKDITYFPVFYHMDPSVVRKQTGEFQEAFVKHEATFREDIGKVQIWRKALTEVANHSGFDLKDGHESQFIEEIVKEISSKSCFSKYTSVEGLVGINSRLEKLKKFSSLESHDVRMIGICGMGGIGKTTIARVVYDLISCEFEGSSFLANVTEISEKGGLLSLQKMLLSQILNMKKDDINIYNEFDGMNMIRSRFGCKKVLIVLDDVNKLEQLENLARKHDWFGMGSRIIITSRNKRLLKSHGVGVYEAEELNDDEALQLFISNAFKKHQPSESFRELSKRVVKYCSGLPLALKVLGGFFCGREAHIWEYALERLKRDCDKDILDKLQISFDGLEETEKKIFLDIACFFKGMDKHYVTRILKGCDFSPLIGIDILIDKSLIIILDGYKLWMHDLLQQMGQQIVIRECPKEPGKRSRLWMEEDIRHVLTEETGTEVVESIILDDSSKEEIHCCAKAFSEMINLRLLKIRNVQLPEGLDYLPKNLRWLDWKGYPLKSLPPNLQLHKIVELKMDQSRIQQLQGIKPFNNLKSINLEDCQQLIRTPDFTFAPNLKELFLNRCKMLREIHPDLLVHKKITRLSMRSCTSLTTLPTQMHMESLKVLDLSFCYKLKKFPKIIGSMDCQFFNLQNCKNLVSLPVTGLESLGALTLSGCSQLHNLPEFLGQVEKPRTLQESGTSIIRPTASIGLMKNLKRLVFRGCKGPPSKSLSSLCLKTSRLPTLSGLYRSLGTLSLADCNMEEGAIPNDFFSSFSSLFLLDLSKNNFVSLPGSIKHLSQLQYLLFGGCKRLRSLPELPSNITYISVDGCVALETTSNALRLCNSKLSRISCLNCLKLIRCNNLASSMPREFLKAMSKPHRLGMLRQVIKEFEMVIPGSEIPEWFQHQSETSSIKIERHPDYYDNKMMGYAVFCVFDVQEHQPTPSDSIYCAMTNIDTFISPSIFFEENLSDHLWLLYFSAETLNQDVVELSFGTIGPRVEVKKCGIHPVYKKEIEELKPRAKKCSSSCFWNSYELDEDFLGSTADVDSDGAEDEDEIYFSAEDEPRPKRLKADVDSDGAEDEDEIYFSADDEPRPKRLKSS